MTQAKEPFRAAPTALAGRLVEEIHQDDVERGIPCVVSHPDAGGQCLENASFAVYGLAFCHKHALEAKHGALAEIVEDMEAELEQLTRVERDRHATNEALAHALEHARWGRHDFHYYDRLHEATLKEAYPPLEGRANSAIAAFDYAKPGEAPVDRWPGPTGYFASSCAQPSSGAIPSWSRCSSP